MTAAGRTFSEAMDAHRLLPLLLLLGCTPAAAQRAPAVTLTYLGVAGWKLTDGKRTILVDPYFSRPSLDDPAAPLLPDKAAIAAHAPARADLILVGHSHFDHVLDVPEIARRTGADILGTESTARLARAAGIPGSRIIPVKGGEDYQFDGFSVRVIPSLHSAVNRKRLFPNFRPVAPDVVMPLGQEGYAEGGSLAYLVRIGGREVFFLSSANFIERELHGIDPDVAVIATGARQEIYDYSCRLTRALGRPPLVLTNHFDAWTQPLQPKAKLSPGTRRDLEAFAAEVRACAPSTRVVVPEHFVEMTVD
jgi:L-ascorbate metabolism protein UlaG (beta-lactamase superfamily)